MREDNESYRNWFRENCNVTQLSYAAEHHEELVRIASISDWTHGPFRFEWKSYSRYGIQVTTIHKFRLLDKSQFDESGIDFLTNIFTTGNGILTLQEMVHSSFV